VSIFWWQNGLQVDQAANRLVDMLSFESFPTVTEQSNAFLSADSPVASLCAAMALVIKWVLDRFHEVVNPEKWLLPKTKHHIRMKVPASGSREVCDSKSGV
jgi:hypothetical protein